MKSANSALSIVIADMHKKADKSGKAKIDEMLKSLSDDAEKDTVRRVSPSRLK